MERMTEDIRKQQEMRANFSRRRPGHADSDISYINDRNQRYVKPFQQGGGTYTLGLCCCCVSSEGMRADNLLLFYAAAGQASGRSGRGMWAYICVAHAGAGPWRVTLLPPRAHPSAARIIMPTLRARLRRFNKKLERYYGEHTRVIKDNLERGTAL